MRDVPLVVVKVGADPAHQHGPGARDVPPRVAGRRRPAATARPCRDRRGLGRPEPVPITGQRLEVRRDVRQTQPGARQHGGQVARGQDGGVVKQRQLRLLDPDDGGDDGGPERPSAIPPGRLLPTAAGRRRCYRQRGGRRCVVPDTRMPAVPLPAPLGDEHETVDTHKHIAVSDADVLQGTARGPLAGTRRHVRHRGSAGPVHREDGTRERPGGDLRAMRPLEPVDGLLGVPDAAGEWRRRARPVVQDQRLERVAQGDQPATVWCFRQVHLREGGCPVDGGAEVADRICGAGEPALRHQLLGGSHMLCGGCE